MESKIHSILQCLHLFIKKFTELIFITSINLFKNVIYKEYQVLYTMRLYIVSRYKTMKEFLSTKTDRALLRQAFIPLVLNG